MDTPDNLTSRLRGSETLYVQVDSMGVDAKAALEAIPGVTRVELSDTTGAATGFEINSEMGRDVRRQLSSAIVTRGWGLLELRPLRMSLEDVFLHLTTEDAAAPEAEVEVEVAHE